MYRKDAPRPLAEFAANGAAQTAPAEATWILPDQPAETPFSTPTAGDRLAEIDSRINALAGQLAALPDPTWDGTNEQVNLDYLLDQYRILTFTFAGTMSRQITDAGRIPVGLLQSMLTRFANVTDRLSTAAGRVAGGTDRVDEIQRQARSVSRKSAIVVERLCGSRASDFLDDLEAILAELAAIARRHSAATSDDVSQLGQRLCEVLAQFEDAVHQSNQYGAFGKRFQRLAQDGTRTLDRLLEQPAGEHHAEIVRLHVRFGFAATQFGIRCNNAAMPDRTIP